MSRRISRKSKKAVQTAQKMAAFAKGMKPIVAGKATRAEKLAAVRKLVEDSRKAKIDDYPPGMFE